MFFLHWHNHRAVSQPREVRARHSRPAFTAPSQASFMTLAASWVMTVGPRTVTNLIRTAGPKAVKSHDAYQYFFSRARWTMDELWHALFQIGRAHV